MSSRARDESKPVLDPSGTSPTPRDETPAFESRRARRLREEREALARTQAEGVADLEAATGSAAPASTALPSRRARRLAAQNSVESASPVEVPAQSQSAALQSSEALPTRRARRRNAAPSQSELFAGMAEQTLSTSRGPRDAEAATSPLADPVAAEPDIEAEPDTRSELLVESVDDAPSPESVPTATDSFEAIIAGAFPTDASSEAPDEEPVSSETTDEPESAASESKRERRARHRASSDAPVDRPRAPRSIRRIAARTMSVSALLAVGLMTVATSIPANALLSADDVQQQKRQAQVQAAYGTDAAQSMVNTASADTSVHRDTYGALSATEAAVQLGIKPESTFTNDPNGTVQWPFSVGVHIGSGYGPRAGCSLGCSTNHLGQDFNPGYGAPIQAIADGVVVESTDSGGGFGVKIVIEHVIDGQMIHSLYGHMIHGSRTVQVGDHVSVGQIIGKTGNTGISTGPHMHFEILINGTEHVDPLAWLYENTN